MIRPSFLKSSLVYTVGGALPVLAGIILLPFYTNYLSPKIFLQLTFYISISLFVQIFYNFSLDTYVGIRYSELSAKNVSYASWFVYQTGQWTWLWGIFWSMIFILSGPSVFRWVFKSEIGMEFGGWAILSLLTGFFNSAIRTGLQVLMYEKKPARHFLINGINFVLTTGLGIWGTVYWADSLAGPIWARFISTAITFLIIQPVFFRREKGITIFHEIKDMLDFCFPYFLFLLATWLLSQADRYLLQHHLNEKDLNAYDVLQKCYLGIEFVQNTFTAVVLQAIYIQWAKSGIQTSEENNRYFHAFTGLNLLILPAFNVFVPMVYQFFIVKQYFMSALDYIGLMACWYAFRPLSIYYMAAFLYSKKIYPLMAIFLVSSAIQLSGIYFFTTEYGIMAALVSGIIARIVQVILMHIWLARQGIMFKYNPYKMNFLPLLFLIINIIFYFLHPRYSYLFFLSTEALFLLLVYMLYRKELSVTYERYKALLLSKF
ncbi:MAG: hypothetical protein N3F09_01415 [Bacteroidia bacterium]|nr:hypothetical protein [Bacteroidia bacterium]